MGKCWNCGKDVFLSDEEVRCDNCFEVVRYWCHSCKNPFDVQDKNNKKQNECKWCWFFKCPTCGVCGPNCQSNGHIEFIEKKIKPIVRVDGWGELTKISKAIVEYFEEIKMGHTRTQCGFGVPKTYAKNKIKQILARMDGFRVRDFQDQKAFEDRQEAILDEDIGYEFTIGNTRDDGSYGQEYRDVFNLCVCMGTLEYKRKHFTNDKGIKIGYDSWTRIEKAQCPYLDANNLVVKTCPKCKRIFNKMVEYCDSCLYPKGGKKHEKGSPFKLIEKLSNNPTCKNLSSFKKEEEESGEGKFKRET
ncbi:MAG TPA: hypothetical protein VMV95_01725 [Bacillota bacterium]|nr:hypothetical protein [Bacillota bacterium]